MFELIVVVNGDRDGTYDEAIAVQTALPELSVRVFRIAKASVSRARNLGICVAKYKYLTFVDADDSVERNFLSGMLASASAASVSVAPIRNASPDGCARGDDMLSDRISSLVGRRVPLHTVPWIMGFNACKLIPTNIARETRYDDSLLSGEDVVYMAHLLPYNLSVTSSGHSNSAYCRTVVEGSRSRKSQDYDFLVSQRLDVIEALDKIDLAGSVRYETAREALIIAQEQFMDRYVADHPERAEEVHGRSAKHRELRHAHYSGEG